MNPQRITIMRLQKEEQAIEKDPIPNAIVARDGLLNFHFCLYNLDGDYKGGFYHGLFQLHQNYPFSAPKLYFFTPNGRFDTNISICTSFTNYHQEAWTSAWNVRTLILATISFMYSQQPSYGCIHESPQMRRQKAGKSLQYNLKNEEFLRLFNKKLQKKLQSQANYCQIFKQQKKKIQEQNQEHEQKLLQRQNFIENKNKQDQNNQHGRNLNPKKIIIILIIIGLIFFGVGYFLYKNG